MEKNLFILCLVVNTIKIMSCQNSGTIFETSIVKTTTNDFWTTFTHTNSYDQSSPQNWVSSSYPLTILKLERKETEMKCMLEFDQTLYGNSLDMQMILNLKVYWLSSHNDDQFRTDSYWIENNMGSYSLYNSTIYYDSAKSVFYSTMPLTEWSKHINKEVSSY